tara:strand:+ start:645 stop:1928 length:1284 start_codon:yes stop_codon:yes gene_type:complete
MIFAYRVLTTLLYPFLFIIIYFRVALKKEDPKRFREKILVSHFNVKDKKDSKLIWFHAASIGELKSIIPIIYQLDFNHDNLKFLVSTTTLSSGNLAKVEFQKYKNIEHRYFPFDIPFLIDKFINLWKPDKIFLVDSEIWPNLIFKAKKYNVSLALINARLTAKSFNRWISFPNVAKIIFKKFDLVLCSNKETEGFMREFEVRNTHMKGNIKLVNSINEKELKNVNEKILSKRRFWFAASTHQEEDIFCIKTHQKLKEKFNNVITVIAPRHIERVEKIKSVCEKFNLKTQILNKNDVILENKEFIIIKYFGFLPSYFKYAKSVFIGKSMNKKYKNDGGQNPIDAAKLNCKIYHGPFVYNFEEIYEILKKNNISKKINNFLELSENLIKDLESFNKKNNQISNQIKSLEQRTLTETMKLVNNFIINDVN